MSEPYEKQPARLQLDTAAAQAVVNSGLVVANRLMLGQASDEKVAAFVSALRELHLEIAGAIFDAALPQRPVRSGEEGKG